MLEAEIEQLLDAGVKYQPGGGTRGARELQFRLLQMIEVEVGIAQGVDKVAGLKAHHLCDHSGQQRVAGDVERYAKEDIGAALIELAGKPPFGHVELEQAVARRQRHFID